MIEQRLKEWLNVVSAIDCSQPTVQQVRQLRSAIAVAKSVKRPDGMLCSVVDIAVNDLLRVIKDKLRQTADALGYDAADQVALFSMDYEQRSNVWEALLAGAFNLERRRGQIAQKNATSSPRPDLNVPRGDLDSKTERE